MSLARDSFFRSTRKYLPVLVLVAVNVVIGLFIVRDYGMSWDEANAQSYGKDTLIAYTTLLKYHQLTTEYGPGNIRYKGPAFFLTAEAATRLVARLGLGRHQTAVWHFAYFLTFQIAIVSLYALSRRWVGSWAAFGAALLFATQPLLWGHAFINPKDIPFMGFFLASVAAGFAMVDWVAERQPFHCKEGMQEVSASDWKAAVKRLGAQLLKGFMLPYVLLAGALVGYTTSIRILGPWAGGLVALYAVYRIRKYLLGVLVPYLAAAVAATYILWPYLWAAPIQRFIQSIGFMADFPWLRRVMFDGTLIPAQDLPPIFMPKLMLLQLTEAALLLMLVGLVVAVTRATGEKGWQPLALLVLWFLGPLVAIIASGSTVYDNFRQVLFLLPPLFVLAGLALDWLFSRSKRPWLRAGLLALLVLPSIYGIINLHPYEYIYYNAFTGGERGAFRRYEMDYWGTAYREAALDVNQLAQANATVVVDDPSFTYSPYSKASVDVLPIRYAANLAAKGKAPVYDFVVLSSRFNNDLRQCPNEQVVRTIEREGAILAVIKQISSGQADCPAAP
jgi:hypothetical protein